MTIALKLPACRSTAVFGLVSLACFISVANAQQEAPCEDGLAGFFPCSRVDLLARVNLAELGGGSGNDLWGWTDPVTGREYALMGRSNGTAFVDISDPLNPVVVGNLPTATIESTWRDIKVYANHAYVVADNAEDHGMQVFDLSQLRSVINPPQTFAPDTVYTGIGSAHNIAINEQSGFAYVVASETCSEGIHMIDINDPVNPTFAGCAGENGDVHDTQCVIYRGPDEEHRGRELCFNSNTHFSTLEIVDVTDRANPVVLSNTSYPGSAITHQGWLTEDHRHFLLGDEGDEFTFGHNSRTHIFDLADLDSPVTIGSYTSEQSVIDHNLYVRDGFVYEANYQGGLRILSLADVAEGELFEVAFFDTYPSSDAVEFSGAWSVFPFFDSCTVVVSDMIRGLFVLRPPASVCSPYQHADRDLSAVD